MSQCLQLQAFTPWCPNVFSFKPSSHDVPMSSASSLHPLMSQCLQLQAFTLCSLMSQCVQLQAFTPWCPNVFSFKPSPSDAPAPCFPRTTLDPCSLWMCFIFFQFSSLPSIETSTCLRTAGNLHGFCYMEICLNNTCMLLGVDLTICDHECTRFNLKGYACLHLMTQIMKCVFSFEHGCVLTLNKAVCWRTVPFSYMKDVDCIAVCIPWDNRKRQEEEDTQENQRQCADRYSQMLAGQGMLGRHHISRFTKWGGGGGGGGGSEGENYSSRAFIVSPTVGFFCFVFCLVIHWDICHTWTVCILMTWGAHH